MDILSQERRSALMRRIGTRDTRPELVVRRVLHRAGYRFRLHPKNLPGTPDLVLPKWGTAIFVHGCFWHSCPTCDRGRRMPKTNRSTWETKLAQNRQRDERKAESLKALGWRVMVVWQCETVNPAMLEMRLRSELSGATRSPAP